MRDLLENLKTKLREKLTGAFVDHVISKIAGVDLATAMDTDDDFWSVFKGLLSWRYLRLAFALVALSVVLYIF